MSRFKEPDERIIKALANFLESRIYHKVKIPRRGITVVAFFKILNPNHIEIKHFIGNRLVYEKTIINGKVKRENKI